MIKGTHCKCVQCFGFCHAQRLIEISHCIRFRKLSASLKVRFLLRKRVIPRDCGPRVAAWVGLLEIPCGALCSSLEAHDVISFGLNVCLFTVTSDFRARGVVFWFTRAPMVNVEILVLIIWELCQTVKEYLPFCSLYLRLCQFHCIPHFRQQFNSFIGNLTESGYWVQAMKQALATSGFC